jgi:hypothetical protein
MLSRFLPATRASAFDLIVVLGLILGGAFYHWDFAHWANGLIGGESYGDAHFWWDGAVRISDGQFSGHPGKGFRPGYFVLAGITLSGLGADCVTFHKFIVLNFLAATSLLYFAMRQPIGRAAAAAGAALLVFNPFTAEWIATTTTDGLGLVLHLAFGVEERVGIHFRPGGHGMNGEDWSALIDFADRELRGIPSDRRFDELPPAEQLH